MEYPAQTTDQNSKWLRILYMLLFAALYNVAEFLMLVTALFQILMAVFAGGPNQQARRFGQQLAIYAYECWRYLTYNSDRRPFPFDDWPDQAPRD